MYMYRGVFVCVRANRKVLVLFGKQGLLYFLKQIDKRATSRVHPHQYWHSAVQKNVRLW